jgi:hypothetical protein
MGAKQEAAIRVKMILAKVREYGRPALIPLTDYADEETYHFLFPNPGWTFDEWRTVNQETASQLQAQGLNVQHVKVTLPEFFDFLTRYNLPNTPENRAQFAAWIIAPEPRPKPLA